MAGLRYQALFLTVSWITIGYVTNQDGPSHECERPCVDGGRPRTCRYDWTVENYLTLSRACYHCPDNQTDCWRQNCVSADGVTRTVRTVNRALPGPSVQVCEGDRVEVEVVNRMVMGEGLSIHWHGLHQRRSPHMDGVAMVTQCPVPAGSSFLYSFVADTPGTHFWHAHSGLQLADGLMGSFVIRQSPSHDPHSDLYDLDLPEHVIAVNDWNKVSIVETFTRYYHVHGSKRADSILINGRGRLYNDTGDAQTSTPLAEFEVQAGKRYRFRVISAGILRCPLYLSLQGHEFQLLATDGRPIRPRRVEGLYVYSGERYDLLLSATRGKAGDAFWLHVRGAMDCSHLQQWAVLRYVADHNKESGGYFPAVTPPTPNPVTPPTPNPDLPDPIPIQELTSVERDDVSLKRPPDRRVYLQLEQRNVDNTDIYDPVLYPSEGTGYPHTPTTHINSISNLIPSAPLLTQSQDLDQALFCNSSTVAASCRTEESRFCQCLHRLNFGAGDVVEVVMVSNNNRNKLSSHPMHLHGHSFRVVAMEQMPESRRTIEEFQKMDAEGKVVRRLKKAPYKDTLPIPKGSYAVIRFVADNPGVWFFHCHLSLHLEIGMSLYVQVTDSRGRLPSPPPSFPRCGPWRPASSPTYTENAPQPITDEEFQSRDPFQPIEESESAPRDRFQPMDESGSASRDRLQPIRALNPEINGSDRGEEFPEADSINRKLSKWQEGTEGERGGISPVSTLLLIGLVVSSLIVVVVAFFRVRKSTASVREYIFVPKKLAGDKMKDERNPLLTCGTHTSYTVTHLR